ncbi:MAG: RagB/SusD family nutrient uptake outer membrane protein [Tannerella sp.]|jgi:tetratricopeptide (TPR) repeat protein|nr:RagB/SusD family nutrient uptake outer membrane protein [Tannerella sp.]
MKSVLLKSFILIILIVSSVSCEDFFEIKRPQETQWTNTATFEQGLNSAYWLIQWGNGLGRGYPMFHDFAASGTARKTVTGAAGINGDEFYYRKFGERLTRLPNIWEQGYQVITLANLALDLDEERNGNPFNLDINGTDYKNNYLRQIGEYYFCRAYAYFILMKTFAPPYDHSGNNSVLTIPLKDKAAYSKDDVLNEKIGTREEVYQQIIHDFKKAKELLPDQFTLNSWNNVTGYEAGRGNKWAAAAFLGKVYFLMGRYTEAKAEFDDLINYAESTGTYSLEEAPKEAFNKDKAEIYPKESIYEFNGGDPLGTSGQRNLYLYTGMVMGLRFRDSNGDEIMNIATNGQGTVISTWNSFAVSYTALKQMGWMVDPVNGDYTITTEAEADLRYQQVYHLLLPMPEGTPGDNIPKGSEGYVTYESFPGHAHLTTPHVYIDKFFRGEAPYGRLSKFPLIKLADIYLLRGWLKWKANDLQGAANDLNKVWNRSNPHNTNRHTTANITHESIYSEYLRETVGEGWTVDFIMGTQMVAPQGDDPLTPVIQPPYSNWYWPIPPQEESLNPNYQYSEDI